MDGLETQLGKIYIYNRKLSKSYVSVESEEAPATHAELFSILEVSQLSNGAVAQYEKVAKLLASALKKSYARENPDAFENAIASANSQLASLASEDGAPWVGRLNVLMAVRSGTTLSVATSGKVHAYILRDGQLSDLADSPEKQNPLKVLENFAVGKVQKGDFLIFSTPQLFNYISAERIQALIASLPLATACDSIAELIRDNADDQTSFGTLILELGSQDSAKERGRATAPAAGALGAAAGIAANVQAAWVKAAANARGALAAARRATNLSAIGNVSAASVREQAKKYTDIEALRSLPRAKKFFLAAAAACVVLLVANVALAIHSQNVKAAAAKVSQQLTSIGNEINGANSAFMYGDSATAAKLLTQAQADLSKVPAGKSGGTQLSQLTKEASDMSNAINHIDTTNAQQLVTYSGASVDTFVVAGSTAYLVNKDGDLFVPYSLTAGNGKTATSFTVAAQPITNVASINGAIIFTDKAGLLYQLGTGATNPTKEPAQLPADSRGLAFYGSPTRVYTIDQASGEVVSTTFTSTKAPTRYLKQPADLSNSLDLALDGSVYVLGSSSIQKYTSGTLRQFASPSIKLSSGSQIITSNATSSLYVLDTKNNGITQIDKVTGKITKQYRPANLKDTVKSFAVDFSVPSKPVVYVLAGQSLYSLAP